MPRKIVLERMRGAIIAGRFRSSERLIERLLCEQLEVRRSVVREVISYFEAEGLVKALPSRSPVVASLGWEQARQIYDIRLLLEQGSAATCAERAVAEKKTRPKQALNTLRGAFREGQSRDRLDATTHFYEVIFRAARHEVAQALMQWFIGRISRPKALTLTTTDCHVSGPARLAVTCEGILADAPTSAASAGHDHLTETSATSRWWVSRRMNADRIDYVNLTGPDRCSGEMALAPDSFARHGARFLARSDPAETFEGAAHQRQVAIQFPAMASARTCYHSAEYSAARHERDGACGVHVCIIEGVSAGATARIAVWAG